jgi:phosphodiesterase/alkaline phosphatase D-like protein
MKTKLFLVLSLATAAPVALPIHAQNAVVSSAIVRGPWSGAVTANSALVKAKIAPNTAAKLAYRASGGDWQLTGEATAPLTGIVAFPLSNLQANTRYDYAISIGGKLQAPRGQFRTFPNGAASFDFAFGSCARTGSNHPVFRTILKNKPLFFLHSGDLHYEDINDTDRQKYRDAYDKVLASPSQSELYRGVPFVYTWDDHDYAGNDSNRESKGREASRLTYQEYVPHYPLPAGNGNVPIYHAFSVGRARFIVSDLRSERSPADMPDGPEKTMLGAAQKEWLKNELLAAKGKYPLIFWVSSVTWNGRAVKDAKTAGVDNWAAYDTERKELVKFIKDNNVSGLCVLSGDAHMLGADSGANVAAYTGLRVPALQAASLDQYSSLKGGPKFDRGFYGPREDLSKPASDPLKYEGCYGWVSVRDEGAKLTVRFSGRNQDDKELVSHEFSVAP